MRKLQNIIILVFLFCAVSALLPEEDEEDGVEDSSWDENSLMNPEESDPSGDIILEPLFRNGLKSQHMIWSNGIIPYKFSNSFDTRHQKYRKKILEAMDRIHKVSCIRFVLRTTERNYILIQNRKGCKSVVGRYGGSQPLYLLAPKCFGKKIGTVIHELLHTIGFFHEHNRPDRDNYININYKNLPFGQTTPDFLKRNPRIITNFGLPYDYFSVTHFSEYANSINGNITISSLNANVTRMAPYMTKIGQRNELSDYDILKLNIMYGCTMVTGRWYVNGTCSGFTRGDNTYYYSGDNAWRISEDNTWINTKNSSSIRLFIIR